MDKFIGKSLMCMVKSLVESMVIGQVFRKISIVEYRVKSMGKSRVNLSVEFYTYL